MYSKYAIIRDERGLTDYQVCKKANIRQSTMTAWKQGAYTPKYETKMKIAKVLKINVKRLME